MSDVEKHVEAIINQYLFEIPDITTFRKIKEDLKSFSIDDIDYAVPEPSIIFNQNNNSLTVRGKIFNRTLNEEYGDFDVKLG